MAGNIAHLSSVVQNQPSFFDCIAQESLDKLLYPAVKKIVDVLYVNYPEKFFYPVKYYDEFFLGISAILQFNYLKNYGSTFSENFYGLKRVSLTSSENIPLSKKEVIASFFVSCFLPYFRRKIEKFILKCQLDDDMSNIQRHKMKYSTYLVCHSFHVLYETLRFVQLLKYLSGVSNFYSPELWLARVKLEYLDDSLQDNETVWGFRSIIPQLLRKSLEVGAFFVQFLQFWQNENVMKWENIPVPPPPITGNKHPSSHCPICLQKRKIDTVLAVSGYLFCFKCINEYLNNNNSCPVTNLPATVDNLIRLHIPS